MNTTVKEKGGGGEVMKNRQKRKEKKKTNPQRKKSLFASDHAVSQVIINPLHAPSLLSPEILFDHIIKHLLFLFFASPTPGIF